jgi:hypothetical protein
VNENGLGALRCFADAEHFVTKISREIGGHECQSRAIPV